MKISQDHTPHFIPSEKPQFIILGTMVAINARSIDGVSPKAETFYYNNSRNHFWRVVQHLFSPNQEPTQLSIPQKKDFLNRNKIAIVNLVHEIVVPNAEAGDPSDTILFKAYKKNRLKFKTLPKDIKNIITQVPMFFTCRNKKGIQDLVNGYFGHNHLPMELQKNIHYLPTPTRCNPLARSKIWKTEMQEFWPLKI